MNYTLEQINAMEADDRITALMAQSARLRIAATRLSEQYDEIRAGIEKTEGTRPTGTGARCWTQRRRQEERNIPMTTGMLWFDNSNKALSEKVRKAVAYYKQKYNLTPTLCLVHPNMLKDETLTVEGVTVRPYRSVLPGHLWLGVSEKQKGD